MKYFIIFVISLCLFCGCQDAKKRSETTNSDTTMQEKITPMIKATLLLDAKSALGEGALWNKKTQELYWIDIEKEILHIYTPASQQDRVIKLGQRIGTVVPTEDGNVLVALEDGIYEVDLKTEAKKLLTKRPEKDFPENRFNDGKCDPAGRFWVGTMSMKGIKKAGALYIFDNEQKIAKVFDSVTVSNGIVWSLDSTKMYYIDTPTKEVKAFEYNNETGAISFSKVVVRIPDGMGYPDGMTIDSEGMLWIGMWEGYSVTRWNPTSGELLMKIDVPVARVTSCAFGGENLDTLYITTASVGAKEEELKQYPNSGSLFVVKTGHTGITNFEYKKKKKMVIGF
jgi:sugar lactone lactonase YvrE